MNMTDKMQKGIITIVIAAVIFAIGCWDRIEIIGRYKLIAEDGEKISEQLEDADLKARDVKTILKIGPFGGLRTKIKLSNKAEDEMGKEYVKFVEKMNDEKDTRWFLDDGEFKTRDKDTDKDDVKGGQDYKVGIFNSLVIGGKDKDEGSLYRRTFPLGYICPSIILKAAAIVVLVKGVKMVTGKDEEGTPIA